MPEPLKPQPITEKPESGKKITAWLLEQANPDRPFLLAFADDGVIWGGWKEGKLAVAPAEFSGVATKLRDETLQMAFMFGEKDEVRLFKDTSGQWVTCTTSDVPGQEAFDEFQILWGDSLVLKADGFVHLRDVIQQGMDQVIPLDISEDDFKGNKVPRLQVRHFVEYDESGEARIFLSRLVKLGLGPAAKEEIA